MARKRTPTLTDAELRCMDIVWEKGQATVHDILDALPEKNRPAYNTILTIMRILEQKEYVRHTKEGRAYIYQPLVGREQARRRAIRHVVSSFFDNSPELLLANMLKDEKIDAAELKRLKQMIDDAEDQE